jgi:hypothetical protein
MSNVEIINDFGADNQKKQLKNLPAKYNKFAVFSFWLSEKIRESSPEAADAIANLANIRSRDVPSQIEFYEEFVSQEKIHAKALRTIIMAKPKKEKLPKENKPRKPRAKKDSAVEQVTNNDIISQIVSRANSVEDEEKEEIQIDNEIVLTAAASLQSSIVVNDTLQEEVLSIEEPKKKVVKEPKEKVVKEPKEKVVKEKVVKKKVVKKTKVDEDMLNTLMEAMDSLTLRTDQSNESKVDPRHHNEDEDAAEDDEDDDDEDLQLTFSVINGVQCYRDDSTGNLYDLQFQPLIL